MPWKETTAMSEKKHFIEILKQSNQNMSKLCKAFNISRTTGYLWKKRYENEGELGLHERSKEPIRSPNKTPKSIEMLCVELRLEYPRWGGDKIRARLLAQGYLNMPTEKTIDRILKRYGLITAEASEKHKALKRFEHEQPNDLWQMDFKGDFKIHGEVCYPLTILDDHSRFCLCVKACRDQRTETVKQALIEVFKKYGLPKRMTMDNGPPWGYSRKHQHTKLCAWLIHLGIKVSHSRPGHPQTQGKLERMHRTLKEELLTLYRFENFEEVQIAFDDWRYTYNEIRPHGALNYATPNSRYKASLQPYPDRLPDIIYDDSFVVRKVQRDGEISLHGKLYTIGTAFHGYPVGLKATENKQLWEVHFCHQKINIIDLNHAIS